MSTVIGGAQVPASRSPRAPSATYDISVPSLLYRVWHCGDNRQPSAHDLRVAPKWAPVRLRAPTVTTTQTIPVRVVRATQLSVSRKKVPKPDHRASESTDCRGQRLVRGPTTVC